MSTTQLEGLDYGEVVRDFLSVILDTAQRDYPDQPLPGDAVTSQVRTRHRARRGAVEDLDPAADVVKSTTP